jgi:hypothetical protein
MVISPCCNLYWFMFLFWEARHSCGDLVYFMWDSRVDEVVLWEVFLRVSLVPSPVSSIPPVFHICLSPPLKFWDSSGERTHCHVRSLYAVFISDAEPSFLQSLSIYLSIYLSIHLSIHPSIYRPIDLSNYLSIHPSIYLFIPAAPTWNIGHPWNAFFSFQFINLRQSVGLLGRGISPT